MESGYSQMMMKLETYDQECRHCPSLTDCKDKGIGCYRVIATDDTYKAEETE